ncbi:MAG: hypothetical protein D6772_02075 [Bacteroidetes bacterium]|nr:MAG: hypothetical protein D6772_02075 [Bacteroidota bacterium]
MHRSSIYLLWFGLLLWVVWACEKESLLPRAELPGSSYFPTELGAETFYRLDSIVLRPEVGGIRYDSVLLEVREVLADTLRDLEGKLWYRGERYDRRLGSTDWRFRQSFLLRRERERAYRSEDNLEFVKLVFPARVNTRWDGNRAFDDNRFFSIGGERIQLFQAWNYRYLSLDEAGQVGEITYDSLLVVEGVDYDEGYNRRYYRETYAARVGLVAREMEVFDTQCRDCCFNQEQVDENGNPVVVVVARRQVDGRDTLINCVDLPWNEKAEGGLLLKQWRIE